MSKILFFLVLTLSCAAPWAATVTHATPSKEDMRDNGIVAVINDEPITAYDLLNRMELILFSSSLDDTPESRARLVPQVMQNLIMEKLYLQEAQRREIKAAPEEIESGIAHLASQNNATPEELLKKLEANGIDPSTLREKVAANIVWQKLVPKKAGDFAEVTSEEVNETLAALEQQRETTYYRYADIFLPVEDRENDQQVKGSIEELFDQLREGANFQKLAQTFSRSPTADEGGDSGWRRQEAVDEEVRLILDELEEGFLTPPVRLENGYAILLLVGKRVEENNQATIPSRAQILRRLRGQKLDQVARKYLNDLRESSTIQLRLGPGQLATQSDASGAS